MILRAARSGIGPLLMGSLCLCAQAQPSGAHAASAQTDGADARRAEIAGALAAGDSGRALELSTRYLQTHPSDARVRVLLARVHITRGDLEAAYGQLRRALRDDPRDVDAHYYLALVSARLAERQFERLIEIAPDSARVHQLRAESLEAQERRAAAEAEYEAALERKPDLLEALLALGKLKRIRLECEDAIALYERAERVRPTFDAAFGLGICYGYVDRHPDAVRRFEDAIRRDPTAAVAWAGLGSALTKLGRTEEAIARLQRAIELEPSMGEAYYALGFAYQTSGRTEQARKAFARAQELRTNEPAPSSPPPPR